MSLLHCWLAPSWGHGHLSRVGQQWGKLGDKARSQLLIWHGDYFQCAYHRGKEGVCQTLYLAGVGTMAKVKTLQSKQEVYWISHTGPLSLSPLSWLPILCGPTLESRVWHPPPFWSLPCSSTTPTSWPPGVCTTSAPTTTAFVPSSARKSNRNLQVRLWVPMCPALIASNRSIYLCALGKVHEQQAAHGEFLVTGWQSHACDMTQGLVGWEFSLKNFILEGFGWSGDRGSLLHTLPRLLLVLV